MSTTVARGLSPVRIVLPNRMVVLVQENPSTPAVALSATFEAGAVLDPDPLPGVAYLTAKTIDRGTSTRSAEDLADLLDERGVSLRVSVARHTVSISCVCLSDDLAEVLGVVADVLRAPAFSPEQVEKRRIKAITTVRQDADSTTSRSSAVMFRSLYGPEHPYGRPRKGTVATLERITREDLVAFHAGCLVPSSLRLALAGDLDPLRAADMVASAFGDWTGGGAPLAAVPPPPPHERSLQIHPMPGRAQTDIAYGFTTIPRLDPSFYAFWTMNTILGQFGLGGRLADNIRERQGMAYYAYSTMDGMHADSPLVIRAGVDPANVVRALAAIEHEVRTLAAEGPTLQEFADARESLIGSVPRMLETNESIAEFLLSAEQFGCGTDYDRRLPELLRSVTLDDVAAAARAVLHPRRAAIGIAGPHDEDDAAILSVAESVRT